MRNNTVSSVITRFLMGPSIIEAARKCYDDFGSEGWSYPVNAFGDHRDGYYAEIWIDGMDWNTNIWVIEAIRYASPTAILLAHFEKSEHFDKFAESKELWNACLWHRRNKAWLDDAAGEYIYRDTVWSWLSPMEPKSSDRHGIRRFVFSHASQSAVMLLLNTLFVPEYILEKS